MARLSVGGEIWRDKRRVLRVGVATALVCSLVTQTFRPPSDLAFLVTIGRFGVAG